MEIRYCGICHTDLHQARNDWGFTQYPIVPGHEIVGRVIEVGSEVKRHKVGDAVAIGCIVDSCQHCDQCGKGKEQLCRENATQTYNDHDRITKERTYGGYSKNYVVREEFALKLPDDLDLTHAAPLLCAGITTYSLLRTWNIGPGKQVGVIGLGGLGHMAVKLALAMGAHVTVLSRTDAKKAKAKAASKLELTVDTIPVKHDLNPYIPLLDVDGTLVIVGQIGPMAEVSTVPFVKGRRRVAGSPIGGMKQTQELLDFCARKNILPDCKMIRMNQVNEAFDQLEHGRDIDYRFVIDMASLKAR